MIPAIYDRRSIRRFLDAPISREDIEEVIQSGMRAPSAKNRQPWRFIVVQGREKEEMLDAFRRGIRREKDGEAFLPQSREHIAGAEHTAEVMAEAPVILLVIDALGKSILAGQTPEERVSEICDVQSIGAAIQNMLLTAEDKGIGSLWICDIFFAYPELSRWLDREGGLVAAVALGLPNEAPGARPRRSFQEIVEWRG